MPRLPNKGYTARAPDGAGSWPEIPDIDPQLSEIDGGKTNAAFQRWNDLVRARLGGNEQQDNGRFKNIQTAISRSDGYLESVWTMQAIAGQVVTGMTLFSSTGPEPSQTVSRIAFQADVFQINTASGNKQIFSATASEVLLGDVLTVDLANAKMFIGDGNFGAADTPFYVDDLAFFSLGEKLTFDGDLLTVGNAYIDSDGAIVLGTSNDVLILTAADATYRIWIGNATSGSAAFRVTKAGIMTAVGGIFSNAGTAGDFVAINGSGLTVGANAALGTIHLNNNAGVPYLNFRYNGNVFGSWSVNSTRSIIQLTNSAGTTAITIDPAVGGGVTLIGAIGFAGDGSLVSNLNASFLASGTVGTARLGSGTANGGTWLRGDQTWAGIAAGDVSGLAASATTDTTNAANISTGTLPDARLAYTATGTADVPITGFVMIGGAKVATVA